MRHVIETPMKMKKYMILSEGKELIIKYLD